MVSLPDAANVSVRRIPYPYRAMLAICSDLDETPDWRTYLGIIRYLNTSQHTELGTGVGLEVGNSIYFAMNPGEFSYWNADETERDMIRTLIRSGHIDCLHSFGDLATKRFHAGRALEELSRHGCRLEVWIDHAVAPSNFGQDIMHGLGDMPGSDIYHADLTYGFGIRYVWRGRVTSVIGQEVRRDLGGIYDRRIPLVSGKTVAKEFAKGVLAYLGSEKYAMHGPNQVIRNARLRSGHEVYEILRSNPYKGGVNRGETAEGLAEVINESFLDCLVRRGGICVLYTHLGKIQRRDEPFGIHTRRALELLARYAQEKKILVTTTRRLLRYCRNLHEVSVSAKKGEGDFRIEIMRKHGNADADDNWSELEGLTLFVPDSPGTRVFVGERQISNLQRNAPDNNGMTSVSFPWKKLEFPSL